MFTHERRQSTLTTLSSNSSTRDNHEGSVHTRCAKKWKPLIFNVHCTRGRKVRIESNCENSRHPIVCWFVHNKRHIQRENNSSNESRLFSFTYIFFMLVFRPLLGVLLVVICVWYRIGRSESEKKGWKVSISVDFWVLFIRIVGWWWRVGKRWVD